MMRPKYVSDDQDDGERGTRVTDYGWSFVSIIRANYDPQETDDLRREAESIEELWQEATCE